MMVIPNDDHGGHVFGPLRQTVYEDRVAGLSPAHIDWVVKLAMEVAPSATTEGGPVAADKITHIEQVAPEAVVYRRIAGDDDDTVVFYRFEGSAPAFLWATFWLMVAIVSEDDEGDALTRMAGRIVDLWGRLAILRRGADGHLIDVLFYLQHAIVLQGGAGATVPQVHEAQGSAPSGIAQAWDRLQIQSGLEELKGRGIVVESRGTEDGASIWSVAI